MNRDKNDPQKRPNQVPGNTGNFSLESWLGANAGNIEMNDNNLLTNDLDFIIPKQELTEDHWPIHALPNQHRTLMSFPSNSTTDVSPFQITPFLNGPEEEDDVLSEILNLENSDAASLLGESANLGLNNFQSNFERDLNIDKASVGNYRTELDSQFDSTNILASNNFNDEFNYPAIEQIDPTHLMNYQNNDHGFYNQDVTTVNMPQMVQSNEPQTYVQPQINDFQFSYTNSPKSTPINNSNIVFTSNTPLTPQIVVSPEHETLPSLFSPSSRGSSRRGSMDRSKYRPKINVEDTDNYLNSTRTLSNSVSPIGHPSEIVLNVPTSFDEMREGRRRKHSITSRSSSKARSRASSNTGSDLWSASEYDSHDPDEGESSYDEGDGDEGETGKLYICEVCKKEFNRPYNLKSHQKTHTNERPYSCRKCGKTFARQHDRKRHEDLHSGERRFQCKGIINDGSGSLWGCGKRFARPDALRRHFWTESGKGCIRPCIISELGDGSGESWETDGVKFAMLQATKYQESIKPKKK